MAGLRNNQLLHLFELSQCYILGQNVIAIKFLIWLQIFKLQLVTPDCIINFFHNILCQKPHRRPTSQIWLLQFIELMNECRRKY